MYYVRTTLEDTSQPRSTANISPQVIKLGAVDLLIGEEILDIASISAIVAAVSVIIGVGFTVLELRNLVKARKTDLTMRLASAWHSEGMMEKWLKVMNLEFTDYADFKNRYGAFHSNNPEHIALYVVLEHFEVQGYLLHRKMTDFDLADLSPVSSTWRKTKPVIEGFRKEYNSPRLNEWFEYLYNEMKKREQQAKIG